MIKISIPKGSPIVDLHKNYAMDKISLKLECLLQDAKISRQYKELLKDFFYENGVLDSKFIENIAVGNLDLILNHKKIIEINSNIESCLLFEKIIELKDFKVGTSIEREKILLRKNALNNFLLDFGLDINSLSIVVLDNYFSNKKIFNKLIDEIIESRCYRSNIIISLLDEIFSYDQFCSNVGWNRNELLSLLGVSVCPYCNRQYITSFDYLDNNSKSTADLDHFYLKKRYPFLAISLFNFIPSCQICNSRFKGVKNFILEPHLYPYEEEFGDLISFCTTFDNNFDSSYLYGESTNFLIEIEINKAENYKKVKRAINSIKTFKILELYNKHKKYASDIIYKSVKYNDILIEELLSIEGLFESSDEIRRLIFGSLTEEIEINNTPLGKLTFDLINEFKDGNKKRIVHVV